MVLWRLHELMYFVKINFLTLSSKCLTRHFGSVSFRCESVWTGKDMLEERCVSLAVEVRVRMASTACPVCRLSAVEQIHDFFGGPALLPALHVRFGSFWSDASQICHVR